MLRHILLHVTETATLRAFARTSKGMLAMVASDDLLTAQWLLKHKPGKALILAAKKGRGAVVLQLLKLGAVSATAPIAGYYTIKSSDQGYPPIVLASEHNLVDVVTVLIQNKLVLADLAAVKLAQGLCSELGHHEILKLLLTHTSQTLSEGGNLRGADGLTLLHRAAYYSNNAGSVETIRVLLDPLVGHALCTIRDATDECVALHFACKQPLGDDKRALIVALLLSADSSVLDVGDHLNNTALHYVALFGLASCCRVLLDAGSQALCMRNNYGKHPFEFAQRMGHSGVLQVMRRSIEDDDDWFGMM